MKRLHADHIDTTGAYGQTFAVIKGLVDSGALTDIPAEFCDDIDGATPIITTTQTLMGRPQVDTKDRHADHVDETGEYALEYEKKFGVITNQQEKSSGESSWKDFLQKIIAEEKSKLKV
jgi:hypothetical protein